MADFKYEDVIVDGKKLSEWLKSDGDICISETNHHVFVKGRFCDTQEEWHAAVDELYSREY